MIDFTSALYLGLRHEARSLPVGRRLTTGRPALLGLPAPAEEVAAGLASLLGRERAGLWASSLHAFTDVFGALSPGRPAILVDAAAYPIARWAVPHGLVHGGTFHLFSHHDPEHAVALARKRCRAGRWVILTDGYCPDCGRPAPLETYLDLVHEVGGVVVVDDTQAVGVLGARPPGPLAYGTGGGGTLAHSGVGRGPVVVVASLAKAFGAPVAVVGGEAAFLARLERVGKTRAHASPPSLAALAAADRALRVDRDRGDGLRRRLAGLVRRFRDGLTILRTRLVPSWFPAQYLRLATSAGAGALSRRLRELGIRTIPVRLRCQPSAALGILLTARHRISDIDDLTRALETLSITELEAGV